MALCLICSEEQVIPVAGGGYLVVGLDRDDEIALVYASEPRLPQFDEPDLPDLMAPGYVSLELKVCKNCGGVSMQVPQKELELLDALDVFVNQVWEIEDQRYGDSRNNPESAHSSGPRGAQSDPSD